MAKGSGQVEVARNSLKLISPGLWKFAITMGGFIVNGFTYNSETRQIRTPSCNYGSGPRRMVRAFGIHVQRLRDRVELEIGENANGD
jgi:hypothetical protein